MVATINEALERRLFSLEPDGIEVESQGFAFEVEGIPVQAEISDAGFDEISIGAAIWPLAGW